MSCQIKLNNKPPKSQTPSKSKHKTRVAHVAKSSLDRGGGGQGKVKARYAGWDPQPGRLSTEARSMFTGLSSKVHSSCILVVCLLS